MLHDNSKDEIINLLSKDLVKISFNKELKEKIINSLQGRINKITITNLFNTPQNIEMLKEGQLYFILKSFCDDIYKDKKHDVKQYFTDVEINIYDSQPLIKEEKNTIIEIPNIDRIESDVYFCNKINIDKVVDVTESGALTYDPRVQRSLKVIKKGDEYIKRIWRNNHSVKEISKSIIKGSYFLDDITWNILKYPDGRENDFFQYDEENKILRITPNSAFLLQIIDGWHRTMGMSLAKTIKPDLKDRYIQLRVTHYTMDKANEYINQKSKINKFTVSKQSSLENSEENLIVRQLNSYGTEDNNLLCNKIGIELNELRIDKLILFNSLAYLIKNNFNLDNMNLITRGVIVEYLIDFFNIVLTLNKDRFDFKNENLSTNQNLLCAMTAIAGELYGKNSWKNKLMEFLNNFNWEDPQFKNYSLGLSYAKFKELSNILLKQYSELEMEVV